MAGTHQTAFPVRTANQTGTMIALQRMQLLHATMFPDSIQEKNIGHLKMPRG